MGNYFWPFENGFLMMKSEKKGLISKSPMLQILHFWNRLTLSYRLAKTEFLVLFFYLTGLQDPCAKNCFLWGRWNWNPFLRIRELHLLSVEGKIFVQQMQTRWTLSKKVGKINLIPDAMSSHGALETIVVPLKTLGALRSPHHSSPFPIIFILISKFCSPHHWRGSARNDITL